CTRRTTAYYFDYW
nr:immunoglobulin heavy chain junction region [Mus musculus]